MFLDIQMPDLDGFAVIAALEPEQQPVTVFVTAYDRYAIQAFEARAVDYLLKPFSDQRFEGALRRACQFLRSRRAGDVHVAGPMPDDRGGESKTGFLERFVLKAAGRVTFLGVEDVDWIEASGVYVNLHVGPRTHLYRSSLAHLLQRLDPQRFVRVHRSAGGEHHAHPRAPAAQPRRLHGDPQERHRAGDEPRIPAAVRALAEAAAVAAPCQPAGPFRTSWSHSTRPCPTRNKRLRGAEPPA